MLREERPLGPFLTVRKALVYSWFFVSGGGRIDRVTIPISASPRRPLKAASYRHLAENETTLAAVRISLEKQPLARGRRRDDERLIQAVNGALRG